MSPPTEPARIEEGSLWYCNGGPVRSFCKQYIVIIEHEFEDAQGNASWKVYVTPRMIFVSLYEVNINNHFARIA